MKRKRSKILLFLAAIVGVLYIAVIVYIKVTPEWTIFYSGTYYDDRTDLYFRIWPENDNTYIAIGYDRDFLTDTLIVDSIHGQIALDMWLKKKPTGDTIIINDRFVTPGKILSHCFNFRWAHKETDKWGNTRVSSYDTIFQPDMCNSVPLDSFEYSLYRFRMRIDRGWIHVYHGPNSPHSAKKITDETE